MVKAGAATAKRWRRRQGRRDLGTWWLGSGATEHMAGHVVVKMGTGLLLWLGFTGNGGVDGDKVGVGRDARQVMAGL